MPYPRTTPSEQAGFSLLEMLIALALLSLITTLILTAIQGTGRALDVANRQVQEGSIGAAQLVLRQILSQAQPIKRAAERVEDASLLEGIPERLRFVTSYAAGGQYGGLYDTEIATAASAERTTAVDLVVQQSLYRRVAPGTALVPPRGRQATILKSVAKVSVRYFGRADEDAQPDWAPTWTNKSRLPTLIALDVQFPEGDPRKWPQLIVAIREAE